MYLLARPASLGRSDAVLVSRCKFEGQFWGWLKGLGVPVLAGRAASQGRVKIKRLGIKFIVWGLCLPADRAPIIKKLVVSASTTTATAPPLNPSTSHKLPAAAAAAAP
jgi:hypothetical protein